MGRGTQSPGATQRHPVLRWMDRWTRPNAADARKAVPDAFVFLPSLRASRRLSVSSSAPSRRLVSSSSRHPAPLSGGSAIGPYHFPSPPVRADFRKGPAAWRSDTFLYRKRRARRSRHTTLSLKEVRNTDGYSARHLSEFGDDTVWPHPSPLPSSKQLDFAFFRLMVERDAMFIRMPEL